jgi:translation initiation factor IF-3
MPIEQARRLADEKGLDLVEVAPDARPPVCKVMDYGKFRYTLKKKEHDAKKKSHATQLKEIRLRPKIDKHDRDFKINQARGFLAEGHKVQFNMLFRGREMAHQDVGRAVMDAIVKDLAEVSKIERHPSMEGRRMTMLLTHK